MTARADRQRLVRGLLAAWVAAVAVLTLRPVEVPSLPAGEPEDAMGAVDRVANVALFVPGGLLGAAATGTAAPVVAGGAALSGAVEATQMLVPGRRSRVDDVGANTAGGLIGVLLWIAWVRLRRRPDVAAARLERAAWILFAFGHIAAAVLWSPSPAFDGGSWSAGIASDRQLGLPSGAVRMPFSETHSQESTTLLADSSRDGRELVRLYMSGDDAVLRSRVLARELGFLQRSLRVEDVATDASHGSEVDVGPSGAVVLRPGQVMLRAHSPQELEAVGRWSLDDLWALVVPAGRLESATKRILQWLLSAAAVAPLFLFAVAGGAGFAGIFLRAAGVGALLVGMPLVFGQPPFDLRLYLGTGIGAGIGAALGHLRWFASRWETGYGAAVEAGRRAG